MDFQIIHRNLSNRLLRANIASLSSTRRYFENQMILLSHQYGKKAHHASSGLGEGISSGSDNRLHKVFNKSHYSNPWYLKKNIPGGAPENPLGVRWIGLEVPGTDGSIYGIHGTNEPNSIGKHASSGCVRMQNEDVTWLYEHVHVGTVVEIVEQKCSGLLRGTFFTENCPSFVTGSTRKLCYNCLQFFSMKITK